MPQLQVIENLQGPRPPEQPNRAQQNLQTFLSNIGNQYRENQDRTQINQLLQEYQQNDDEISAFRNFQVGLGRSDISPSKQLGLQQWMNESEKVLIEQRKNLNAEAERMKKANLEAEKKRANDEKILRTQQETKEILIAGGETPEEAERLAPILTPASARARVKPVNGPKEILANKLATKAADEIVENEKMLAKSQALLENIEEVKKTAEENLRGPVGYAKALFNTQSAAKVTTLSASGLEPVIKMFNPVGALPTQKLNWIRQTFSVSASDTMSTIMGKLETQKILVNQGINRARQRNALLKEYAGNIPLDVEKEFDKQTDDLITEIKNISDKELQNKENQPKENQPGGKIKVVAPDGKSIGYMTQEQIDEAAKKNVIFTPTK